MSRKKSRKKKKHIYLYDPEVQKRIEDLREIYPGKTYDEIFKMCLNMPTTDEVLGKEYFQFIDLFQRKYKDPKLKVLAGYFWIYLLNSGKGQYDLNRLLTTLDADIVNKTFDIKKKISTHPMTE